MVGWHFRIGYMGNDPDVHPWQALAESAKRVASDPAAIVAEARRIGAPERCALGCDLEGFADNYAEPLGSPGHPVRAIEDDEQIMQLASSPCCVKLAVRRAYARLLIAEMHQLEVEVNLTTA